MARRTKELRNRIEEARDALRNLSEGSANAIKIPAITSSHQAEIVAAASELAEISTRRLVWLTWGLFILTAGLLAYTVLLYQAAHKAIQSPTLTEHHELQHSQPPPQH